MDYRSHKACLYPGRRCHYMRILLDKILKSKVGCPPKIFSKTKNIYRDHGKSVKKNSKKPKKCYKLLMTIEDYSYKSKTLIQCI